MNTKRKLPPTAAPFMRDPYPSASRLSFLADVAIASQIVENQNEPYSWMNGAEVGSMNILSSARRRVLPLPTRKRANGTETKRAATATGMFHPPQKGLGRPVNNNTTAMVEAGRLTVPDDHSNTWAPTQPQFNFERHMALMYPNQARYYYRAPDKEMEKENLLVGSLQDSDEEAPKVIDLTTSSPVDQPSPVPTSGPGRAEAELMMIRRATTERGRANTLHARRRRG